MNLKKIFAAVAILGTIGLGTAAPAVAKPHGGDCDCGGGWGYDGGYYGGPGWGYNYGGPWYPGKWTNGCVGGPWVSVCW
jgi:hypothetical protein